MIGNIEFAPLLPLQKSSRPRMPPAVAASTKAVAFAVATALGAVASESALARLHPLESNLAVDSSLPSFLIISPPTRIRRRPSRLDFLLQIHEGAIRNGYNFCFSDGAEDAETRRFRPRLYSLVHLPPSYTSAPRTNARTSVWAGRFGSIHMSHLRSAAPLLQSNPLLRLSTSSKIASARPSHFTATSHRSWGA